MQIKLNIKKGDKVLVISGKDKGKQGEVLKIDKKKDRAYVEGLNLIKKHTKPNAASPQGGIVDQEAGSHISNLMLVHNGTPTKVGRKADEKTGKLVRYSKKTGEIIE